MTPSPHLCPTCYNNPPMLEDERQYNWQDGVKCASEVFLKREMYEYRSLCWECLVEKLNQDGAEYENEYRNRLYRELRRDMLEEKDNLDRAARMTKELRNRIRAEA